jgi:hypothetical protein
MHQYCSGFGVELQLRIRCQKPQTHMQVPEVGCVEYCRRGEIQDVRSVGTASLGALI